MHSPILAVGSTSECSVLEECENRRGVVSRGFKQTDKRLAGTKVTVQLLIHDRQASQLKSFHSRLTAVEN